MRTIEYPRQYAPRLAAVLVVLSVGALAAAQSKPPEPRGTAEPTSDQPQRDPGGFRGVAWGSTQAEAVEKLQLREGSCRPTTLKGNDEVRCGEDFNLADVEVTAQYVFEAGRFVSTQLSYYPSQVDFIRDVFIKRYGPATKTTTDARQNRAGASFQDDVTVWELGDMRIEMHRYGISLDRGMTFITDQKWHREQDRRREASKADAVASLDGPVTNVAPVTGKTVQQIPNALSAIAIGESRDEVRRAAGRNPDAMTAKAVGRAWREVWTYNFSRQTVIITLMNGYVSNVAINGTKAAPVMPADEAAARMVPVGATRDELLAAIGRAPEAESADQVVYIFASGSRLTFRMVDGKVAGVAGN